MDFETLSRLISSSRTRTAGLTEIKMRTLKKRQKKIPKPYSSSTGPRKGRLCFKYRKKVNAQ
jgi:hypothetical protein